MKTVIYHLFRPAMSLYDIIVLLVLSTASIHISAWLWLLLIPAMLFGVVMEHRHVQDQQD